VSVVATNRLTLPLGHSTTPKNLEIYRLTSGTSGGSADDASGGPEAQNHFDCKPPASLCVDESSSFLPPGLAQPFEHVGVVFRPHSMVKKRRTLCAEHWTSKPSEA
jgi:hypothetical protein